MKPKVVIFSSSPKYAIAESLYENLKNDHDIVLWKQFFGDNRTTPLWTFLKKLFHYDYAILVLSDDNVILEDDRQHVKKYIPTDNVIFELGATMARLGPQKTILVTPDQPRVSLPGYFDDVQPLLLTYKYQPEYTKEVTLAATADAAFQVDQLLNQVSYSDFHSELPSQGLAYAYISNFIKPTFRITLEQTITINGTENKWSTKSGMTVTVIIPDKIMNRDEADSFLMSLENCAKAFIIPQSGGRPFGLFVLPRRDASKPLHIIDIPTVLLTASTIINSIETFWREKDRDKIDAIDQSFIDELIVRELINFERTLVHERPSDATLYVVPINEIVAHLESLIRNSNS